MKKYCNISIKEDKNGTFSLTVYPNAITPFTLHSLTKEVLIFFLEKEIIDGLNEEI